MNLLINNYVDVSGSVTFPTNYVYHAPLTTPNNARVYLYYGLNSGGVSMWLNPPFSDFVTGLRNDGYSVVLAQEASPQIDENYFNTGGANYRLEFNESINTMMDSVEAANGEVDKNLIGGISYGGLHAIMGSVINGRFDAWFAHLPVVRLDALLELPNVGDVRYFNPEFEIEALRTKHGYASWGTNDTRVDWTLTKALVEDLPNVTQNEYVGLGHSTTSQSVSDMADWINSYVDSISFSLSGLDLQANI